MSRGHTCVWWERKAREPSWPARSELGSPGVGTPPGPGPEDEGEGTGKGQCLLEPWKASGAAGETRTLHCFWSFKPSSRFLHQAGDARFSDPFLFLITASQGTKKSVSWWHTYPQALCLGKTVELRVREEMEGKSPASHTLRARRSRGIILKMLILIPKSGRGWRGGGSELQSF